MILTQNEWEELFKQEAPQPFIIYYTKAIAVIKAFCRNMEVDEKFKDAIAIQIKYIVDKENNVKSMRIGSYSETREQQNSLISDEVVLILTNLGCRSWIGVGNRC